MHVYGQTFVQSIASEQSTTISSILTLLQVLKVGMLRSLGKCYWMLILQGMEDLQISDWNIMSDQKLLSK